MIENILVVDDSPMARSIVKHCLGILGLEDARYLEAGNGQEALAFLEEPLDLVVTDLNMPEMDGAALLGRIRAHPQHPETPVIVLSSSVNEDQTRELQGQGATAVARKPISPPALAPVIESIKEGGPA